jgi:hemerythrin-like domain-containing protein
MKTKSADIIQIIKDDHKPLKAGIKILKSESKSDSEKINALKQFLHDLEVHAKSEERSLYDNTVEEEEVREPILEGYVEHALADLLSTQLKTADFAKNWTDELAAKAKVLAELVEHHIEEEEEEMLPDLRKAADKETLADLGAIYLKHKKEIEAALAADQGRNKKTQRKETGVQLHS